MPRQRNRSLSRDFSARRPANNNSQRFDKVSSIKQASKVFFLLAELTDAYAAPEKPQSVPRFLCAASGK